MVTTAPRLADHLARDESQLGKIAETVYSMAHRSGIQVDVFVSYVARALEIDPGMDLRGWLESCEVDPDMLQRMAEMVPPDKAGNDVLAGRHRDAQQVISKLRGDVRPAGNPGRPTKGSVTPITEGHTRDNREIVARLKRDDPALAQQVIDGQISPNAAAIRAGIRKPYARFRTDNARLAVASLLKHFTAEELTQALEDQSP